MTLPPLKRILPALRYRILRPFLWKYFTGRRMTGLSNDEFFRSLGWNGTPEEFVSSMREQARLRFHFHARNRKDFFLNLLSHTQPYESILEEAEQVLENRFQTLGSKMTDLGWPLNWHRDFKSGKEWPAVSVDKLDLLDLDNPSDVKVPWELSRFHQVWWLGKAFWLTGNARYPEKFRELVDDWIQQNPAGKGANWGVAIEAAIRSCNWIAGYYFFSESNVLGTDFWIRLFRTLLTHGLWIESHLEYARVNGNHFLSNVTGLLHLGVFFKDIRAGRRWTAWSVTRLHREMDEQVHADGVNHEKSTAYHRLVLELFYAATILCKRNTIPLEPRFLQRLERMFDFVLAYTRPDGSVPLVGDADDGRLFRITMDQNSNDHRHALLVGGLLFERSDLVRAAGRFDQEALWYFGGEGFELYQRLKGDAPRQESEAFPEGGFYVLRTTDTHLFFDAGDIGMRGRGGHGHNDTLSYELWVNGTAFIVDSGTYAYTADVTKRKLLQATAAHNAVTVDDAEIAEWAELWTLREDRTNPRVLEWAPGKERDVLAAEHDGFTHLPDPVVYRRRIVFDKVNRSFEIADVLTGKSRHTLQLRLHLHPQVFVEKLGKNLYLLAGAAEKLQIRFSEPAELVETVFSPSYGVLLPGKGLQVRLSTALPHTITTWISPV